MSVAVVMAATSAGLAAGTLVITSPDHDIDLQSYSGGPYDGLDNFSDITQSGSFPAVYSSGAVTTIRNRYGASITGSGGTFGTAIGLASTVDLIENDGTLSATGYATVGVNGLITWFVNTGTIENNGTAFSGLWASGVLANGGFGSFNNSGTISSNEAGVYVPSATTSTFINTYRISGGLYGVKLGSVGDFANSGSIGGTRYNGVEIDGALNRHVP